MKFTPFLQVWLISIVFCVFFSCNKKQLQPAFYNKLETDTRNTLDIIKHCNVQNKYLIEKLVYLHREQNKLKILKANVEHTKTQSIIAKQIQTHSDSITLLTDSLITQLDSISELTNTLFYKLTDTLAASANTFTGTALAKQNKKVAENNHPKPEWMIKKHAANIKLLESIIKRIIENDPVKKIPDVFLPYYKPVYRIEFFRAKKLLSINELKRIFRKPEPVFVDINSEYLYSYGTYYHRDSALKELQKTKRNNHSVVLDMGSLPVHTQVFSKPVIETGYIYCLQVAATEKPIPEASLQKFRKLHPVLRIDTSETLYKYKLGKFVTYEEANDFKTRHKLDAFVCKEKKNE